MSFILDALKKSETERQRQSGPALFEVKVAPPRNGLPLWAVGLAVLLAVNLVIVAWVLLHRPATPQTAAVAAPAQAAAGLPPPMAPAAGPGAATLAPAPPVAQQGLIVGTQASTVPVNGTVPTQTAGLQQAPAASPAPAPQQAQGLGSATPGAPGGANGPLAGAADTPGEKLNPDDYAPAAEPAPVAGFGNHVARNTASGLPLYQDAALAPGARMPELRLDLHVFAAKPQERFVMINMHKLREGDSLPDGVRVESITPEGAVLSQNGSRFLLPRD